jgi:hypothetical protein
MKKTAKKKSKPAKAGAKSAETAPPAVNVAAAPNAEPSLATRARQRVEASRKAAINKVIFQFRG